MSVIYMHPALSVLASLFFALTGCATYQAPVATPADLPSAHAAVAAPAGYLALTLAVDLGAYTGAPTLLLDVRSDDGAVRHLRATGDELRAMLKDRPAAPLVFALPAGHYEVTASQLHLPGGRLDMHEYDASEQPLGLEHELKPFTISADRLSHIGVVRLTLKQTLANNVLRIDTASLVELTRPDPAVWSGYSAALTNAIYLKKTKIDTVTTPPFTLQPRRKALADSDIKPVTHARQGDIDACYLRNSPHAHGRLEVRYVIAPAGTIHEATVASSTLKAPPTEACIINTIKSLKFPPPPDDDFETWTVAWTF